MLEFILFYFFYNHPCPSFLRMGNLGKGEINLKINKPKIII